MTPILLHDKRELLIVEVPEGATDVHIYEELECDDVLRYTRPDGKTGKIALGPGDYTLLFLTSTMTEDDARRVVEFQTRKTTSRTVEGYRDYERSGGSSLFWVKSTALESFASLLKANGLTGNNYCVLEIKK